MENLRKVMNILEPENPDYVTVDGHMISMWHGARINVTDATRFARYYQVIADATTKLAEEERILPNQVQATLWFTWKRLHSVLRHDGTLNLFGDHWQLEPDIDLIRPYQNYYDDINTQRTGRDSAGHVHVHSGDTNHPDTERLVVQGRLGFWHEP